MVKYRLEWTVDGVRHHSEYKSEAIALACFEECSQCKRHSDVTLLEIAPKVIKQSKTPPRLRIFAIVNRVSGGREQYKPMRTETDYFEITEATKLSQFLECVNDREVFSITIYPVTILPRFLRNKPVKVF